MEEKEESLNKVKTELKLRGFSEFTVRNYMWFIKKFIEKTSKPLEQINEDDAKTFLVEILDKKANSTTFLAFSSLKFLFSEVLKKPLILKLPKKEKKFPNVLTKEEFKTLVENAETYKSRLIMLLLYSSGLRVSELVNLKRADMNFNEKFGLVKQGKGKKDRFFQISDKISEMLKQYFEKTPEHSFVFSKEKPLTPRNIQKIIKKAAFKAGIKKKVTPHTMRHSYATHLLDSGVDIRHIQTLLGHENLSTTQLYTHVSTEALKKIKNPLDSFEF